MFGEEAAGNLRDQGLEAVVECVLVGVQRAMAGNDPAYVAGPVLAQQPGRRPRARQQCLDTLHGGDQIGLRGFRQSSQQSTHFRAGTCVERRKRVGAGRRQGQQVLPTIRARGAPGQQAVAFERLQHAAEVARVHLQVAAQFRGGWLGAMGQLVEHPRLGEGEAALQQAFPQRSDDARVEPAEPPDGCDALIEAGGWW